MMFYFSRLHDMDIESILKKPPAAISPIEWASLCVFIEEKTKALDEMYHQEHLREKAKKGAGK